MNLVGLASLRGAPGVTTTALLVAGLLNGPVGLVEADLSGGTLAVRYGLGREPGLTTFAASRATDPGQWRFHAQDAGGVPVLVGPDSPQSASALWHRAGAAVGRELVAADATFVVDFGRVSEVVPLAEHLELLVLLVRPTAEHLVTLSHRLPVLRQMTRQVAVVLVGEGDYRPPDVAVPLGVDVLGVLPHDVRAAGAMAGEGRATQLARSPLVRSATAVAAAVAATITTPETPMVVMR